MSYRDYVVYAVQQAVGLHGSSTSRDHLLDIVQRPDRISSVLWAGDFLGETFCRSTAPCDTPGQTQRPRRPYWITSDGISDAFPNELDSGSHILATDSASRAVASCRSLGLQDRCEASMAVGGLKVSRLTLPLSTARSLQSLLRVSLVISPCSVNSVRDPQLAGFANRMTKVPVQAASLSRNDEVNVFVASDWRDAYLCCVLDDIGAPGNLLGIPRCCRKWFSAHWEASLKGHEGDLACLSIRSALDEPAPSVRWQCNPYSIYFGGSIIGHFPCSSSCEATVRIANDRTEWMSERAPDMLGEILSIQKSPFWVSADRRCSRDVPMNRSGWKHVAVV